MNHWQEMFEKKTVEGGADGLPGGGSEAPGVEDAPDLASPPDPAQYRPWLLQRGRGRPAMFLDLRRFEPKTGMLIGCQMSYPHLFAVDYLNDRMITLDFGSRKFVIESTGLGELPRWLQLGMVLAVQEYSARIWSAPSANSIVTRIIEVKSCADT